MAAFSSCDPVPDLSTCTGGSPVEWFNSGGEIVGFSFQRKHRFNIGYLEIVWFILGIRGKLFNDRSLYKGAIILVGRDHVVGIGCSGAFDQLEQGGFFLLAVDDKGAIEYFVPAMFRVYLGKAEDLTVGKLPARFSRLHPPGIQSHRDSGPGLPVWL